MIAQRQRGERDGPVEIAVTAGPFPVKELQGRGRHKCRAERVDLGDDGVRPKEPAAGECERDGCTGYLMGFEVTEDQVDQRRRERAETGRHQVDAVRERTDRQVGEQMRHHHVKRIPRMVRRAQHVPEVLELWRVFSAAQVG